jgi:hypothetical protein
VILKLLSLTSAVITGLALTTGATARPQIWTNPIGWIDPSDIECPSTSDHTCTVKNSVTDSLACVYADQAGSSPRYRIRAGTEIKVINNGNNIDSRFDSRSNEYHWEKGVEIAIVIPSDWGKDHKIHPIMPCHLVSSTGSRPIVEPEMYRHFDGC